MSSAYIATESTSFHQRGLQGRVAELYLLLLSSKYVVFHDIQGLCLAELPFCWIIPTGPLEKPQETSSWLPSTMLWCLGLRTSFLCCSELPQVSRDLEWELLPVSEPGRVVLACPSPCSVLWVNGELKGHSQSGVTSVTHGQTFSELASPDNWVTCGVFHYSSCWTDLM